MSLIISALAMLIGLVAVYLASDSKQNIEAKIRQFGETQTRANKKHFEDIQSSLDNLYDRLAAYGELSNDLPEFKQEIIGEIVEINNKISDIQNELGLVKKPQQNKSNTKEFEPFDDD